jgi:hypothetical protein
LFVQVEPVGAAAHGNGGDVTHASLHELDTARTDIASSTGRFVAPAIPAPARLIAQRARDRRCNAGNDILRHHIFDRPPKAASASASAPASANDDHPEPDMHGCLGRPAGSAPEAGAVRLAFA